MRWLALLLLFVLTASAVPQEKVFLVTGFERVRVDGPFAVDILSGPSRATATGDARQLERLVVRVDGGTLVITPGVQTGTRTQSEAGALPRITLSTPAIHGLLVNGGGQVRVAEMRGTRVDLALNGGGTIDVGALQSDDLNLTVIGTGRVTASGNSRRGRVRLSGPGTIDAAGLQIGDGTIISESAGEVKLGVRYTVRVFAMGLGKVTIGGTPECKISGPGPVECAGRIVR